MSNPRSKQNGEPLFEEPLQNHKNPFNVNKVNPQHPKYGYYKSLISDLQAWDEYMDSVISDPEDNRPVGGKKKAAGRSRVSMACLITSRTPMPMTIMAIIGMSPTYKALPTLMKSSC